MSASVPDKDITEEASTDNESLEVISTQEIKWNNAFYRKGAASYWVSTYPMFETTLYLSNSSNALEPDFEKTASEELEVELKFYDPDGNLFNSSKINVPNDELLAVNLAPFMSSSKLQGGLKHARLEVNGCNKLLSCIRLYAKETQDVLEPIRFISVDKADFYKLHFAIDRLAYLAITNPSSDEEVVRLKVFTAKHELEVKLEIPGNGARVYEVASLFPKLIALREEKSFPAYLRLVTRSKVELGVQFYEQRLHTPLV